MLDTDPFHWGKDKGKPRYYVNDKLKINIPKDEIKQVVRFFGHPKTGRYKYSRWKLVYRINYGTDNSIKFNFDHDELNELTPIIHEFILKLEDFCKLNKIESTKTGEMYFFGNPIP